MNILRSFTRISYPTIRNMSTTVASVPPTYKALVLHALGKPLEIEIRPVPEAIPGSVVIKVLAIVIDAGFKGFLARGVPGLVNSFPMIPGSRAVGRVATIGADTTNLKIGQLVLCDPTLRARDNHETQILWGMGTFGDDATALKLSSGMWRDGIMGEYGRAPLENIYPLNERVLLGGHAEGGLGYSIADLAYIPRIAVGYGGLRGINLQAGETVIVAPATGAYGSATVEAAIAMGAKVIAVGRNLEKLQAVARINPRVSIYQHKNDPSVDIPALKAFGTIDAFLDISPPMAGDTTHITSCAIAVRKYGRISLMGVIMNNIPVPYAVAVINNLTIRGQYMYEREDVVGLIKLVESGVLKLGKAAGHELLGEWSMDQFAEGLDTAAAGQMPGQMAVLKM